MTTNTAMSAVWEEKGRIALETRPLKRLEENEVKVQVEASGLCGTDIHIAAGETPNAKLGVVIGHEFGGTIVEVGANVVGLAVGERVVIDPNIPCHMCSACRAARPHLCERPQAVGVSRDGGMAQYAILPAEQAYKIPAEMPAEAAALTEPLACALHAVDLAGLHPGQTAIVLGAGPIGILCTSLLMASGAAKVIVSEPNAGRRERVRALGAEAIEPAQLAGRKADVALECVGRPETMRAAVDAAIPGGTIVWVGVANPDTEISIKPFDIYQRELTIRGTYTNPFTMERAIALLASKQIRWEDVVTHSFPLAQFEEAWKVHRAGTGLKVCIKP